MEGLVCTREGLHQQGLFQPIWNLRSDKADIKREDTETEGMR